MAAGQAFADPRDVPVPGAFSGGTTDRREPRLAVANTEDPVALAFGRPTLMLMLTLAPSHVNRRASQDAIARRGQSALDG